MADVSTTFAHRLWKRQSLSTTIQSYSWRSPGRSNTTYLWNDSWVQTFHRIKKDLFWTILTCTRVGLSSFYNVTSVFWVEILIHGLNCWRMTRQSKYIFHESLLYFLSFPYSSSIYRSIHGSRETRSRPCLNCSVFFFFIMKSSLCFIDVKSVQSLQLAEQLKRSLSGKND